MRCGEVLERLSDYVDGELDAAERARVDAHLAGCDWCERFGGAFATTVGRLRGALTSHPIDGAVQERLRAALDDAR
ncbi:MAG: anti-sigma factor [Deltaproteobacteria bacterium]|nr:MAG: anti-sigma factor [Deltaproteobacteria bacterium]